MKKIKYTFLSLIMASALASCDFLDKEPYEIVPENYFQNETEASSALTGIYAILGQSTFYGGDYYLLAGGDDLSCYGGSTGRVSNTGLICNLATTSDPAVTGLWFTLYNGIERANYFLEQIGNVKDITEEKRLQFRDEARFLRAFYYFNLVQNWGDVPFKTQSTSSTESLSGKDLPRTPKDEIYQFIVKEMEEAADTETGGLLSASSLNYLPGRVSKSAAWGILARVYLFWAGEHYRDNLPAPAETRERFEKAAFFAKKVVTDGGHQLSDKYWDIFIDMCSDKYDTSKKHESIWEAEFAGDGTGDVRAEGRIGNTIGIQCSDFSSLTNVVGKADPGYAYAFIWATPKLYELFGYVGPTTKEEVSPDFEKDERFIWNIAPFTYRASNVSKNNGIVGRTFQDDYLYNWVMSDEGYGSVSYDYGLCSDLEYNSAVEQIGDVYTKRPTNRDNTRKDLCCAKFRREYEPATKKNKNMTSINFPILKYSDVLLMLAEAENEVNGPANAYAYINEVRERAGVSDLQAGLSQDEFRNAIKDERAKEMCFELTRRYDLIRWGDYIQSMNEQVSRANSGRNWNQGAQVASFFAIPERYNYFPIPDSEKAVNKLITGNNPGW